MNKDICGVCHNPDNTKNLYVRIILDYYIKMYQV